MRVSDFLIYGKLEEQKNGKIYLLDKEDTTMKEMYFTIAGCNHYYGSDFMEKGMKVKLVKEPDNEYDSEAI